MQTNKVNRRQFLRNGGLTAGSLLAFSLPGWTKEVLEFIKKGNISLHNIPEDKQLDPQWVRSLYERGKPSTYLKSRNELRFIGMPAGGLHSGTVYLGGDGRLWLWGIFNDEREGIEPKTVLWNDGVRDVKVRNRDGASYVEPAIAANRRVLDQGFLVQWTENGKTFRKELREEDWEEIAFEATYPKAAIHFREKGIPFAIDMQAGPIFIPLDEENSALPATVITVQFENTSDRPIELTLAGWLENGACKISAKKGDGFRLNQSIGGSNYAGVQGSFSGGNEETKSRRDYGTTGLLCLDAKARVHTAADPWGHAAVMLRDQQKEESRTEAPGKLVGSVAADRKIGPGEKAEIHFVITWHFDHPLAKLDKLPETKTGYYYGTRFKDAAAVGTYIAEKFEALNGHTQRWQQTYYDSTLPWWLLERSIINTGTLATANTYRFANGRFWGWEGVNACEGTCTHVWQYAQAMGRLFPALERDLRERTDLGIAQQADGGIIFRAEYETRPAIDGQAGFLLRMYREHQMSANDQFLRRNWANTKKAALFLMAQDKNGDGMTDTPMENTLDAVWEGEIAWIVGLSIAAVKAAQMMALDMGDKNFAANCDAYVKKGCTNMSKELFNGEYFIHKPNAEHGRSKLGSYNTCHIDQVYGQGWAFQAGLGRLWDKEKTQMALRSLWKYNFAPDVGPYIKTHTGGRPYAMEGEAGLVMNTNPYNEPKPYGENVTWQLGYFHECMSGFEHQVASHMMAEGITDESLVLTRAIHDRYHAAKRNPYNEIECSDHYARAMASYGTLISACGFEYHGPKGSIRFAPQLSGADFKAPFTVAEGWGTYFQQQEGQAARYGLQINYGSLTLNSISLESLLAQPVKKLELVSGNTKTPLRFRQSGPRLDIAFGGARLFRAGETCLIQIS